VFDSYVGLVLTLIKKSGMFAMVLSCVVFGQLY